MNFKQIGVLLSVSTILGMNLVSNKVLAADPSITFGKAIASGGCVLQGQLVSEDGRTLALIFDKFSAFNGERKICAVRVNTTIPSGFNVQDVQVTYQGSVSVTPPSKGVTFSRRYSLGGAAFGGFSTAASSSTFKTSDPAFERQDELFAISAVSQCKGVTGILGLNLVEQSTPGSSIYIDTADIVAGKVLLHLNLTPCS